MTSVGRQKNYAASVCLCNAYPEIAKYIKEYMFMQLCSECHCEEAQ